MARTTVAGGSVFMVSRYRPARVQRPATSSIVESHSPLEIGPHKASNGARTITCRNRHCPKCQSLARAKWVEWRKGELLPIEYFHIVFTIPKQLHQLAL